MRNQNAKVRIFSYQHDVRTVAQQSKQVIQSWECLSQAERSWLRRISFDRRPKTFQVFIKGWPGLLLIAKYDLSALIQAPAALASTQAAPNDQIQLVHDSGTEHNDARLAGAAGSGRALSSSSAQITSSTTPPIQNDQSVSHFVEMWKEAISFYESTTKHSLLSPESENDWIHTANSVECVHQEISKKMNSFKSRNIGGDKARKTLLRVLQLTSTFADTVGSAC
jgi:hypothetical protein